MARNPKSKDSSKPPKQHALQPPPPTPSGISDVVLVARDGKRKATAASSSPPSVSPFNAVPDDDDYEEAVEGTPITDMAMLFSKMGRTSKQVEQIVSVVTAQATHVAQIPNVAEQAEKAWKAANETREEVIIVRTRQEDMGRRLERIERNGHPCSMKPRVRSLEVQAEQQAEDQAKDAETRVKVETMDKTLEKVQNERKSMSKTVLGIIVTVILAGLTSGGSAVWYIRGLQGDLDLEVQARELRDKNLNDRLKNLPTKEELSKVMPSKSDVRIIAKAANGNSRQERREAKFLREVWGGLSPTKRRYWCGSKRDELPEDLRFRCPY